MNNIRMNNKHMPVIKVYYIRSCNEFPINNLNIRMNNKHIQVIVTEHTISMMEYTQAVTDWEIYFRTDYIENSPLLK